MSANGGGEDEEGFLDGALASDPARGRTRKAPSAFRTISEVADELHVPQHVLRFWETRFPQVKPLKRGGGRRYYRPDDIALLRSISHLLYVQGYTIKGVQRLLREGGGALADDIPPANEVDPQDGVGGPVEIDGAGPGAVPASLDGDQPGLDLLSDASRDGAARPGPSPTAPARTELLRDLLRDLEALRRQLDD